MPQQTAHGDSGFHCGVLNKPTSLTAVYFLKLLQRVAFSCYYMHFQKNNEEILEIAF